jgi:anti-sigma B factor antagonist
MEGFRVEIENEGEAVARLRLVGELDAATVEALRDAVSSVLASGTTRMALDLAELDFVDSTGLGVLVGALKRTREAEGDLVLTAVPPRIIKLLELTGLHKVFTIA